MKSFRIDSFRKDLLLKKAGQIAEILNNDRRSPSDVVSAVFDLIFVFEQLIKSKIAEENFLLLFQRLPKGAEIPAVLNREAAGNLLTLSLGDSYQLYKIVFPDSDITKNAQSVELLISLRNELRHHIVQFKQDIQELSQLARKVYDIQLETLETLVGKVPTAKKSTLTTAEVAKLFEDSVKRKITANINRYQPISGVAGSLVLDARSISSGIYDTGLAIAYSQEICPRCHNHSFQRKHQGLYSVSIFAADTDNGYSCSVCGLELTDEERKVAKKILEDS